MNKMKKKCTAASPTHTLKAAFADIVHQIFNHTNSESNLTHGIIY